MNVFVLCVFGFFYSTYSANIPVTFHSKDDKIDDRDYPVFQDLKHFDERLYRELKSSSSVLVTERTSSSKGFPEELGENTEGNTINPHRRLTRSVLRDPSKRWPNKVIPYVISPSIEGEDRQMIYNAIDDFHQKTCLKFRERLPDDHDYVSIENHPTDGCYSSDIGKEGGKQVINLESPQCYSKGTIIHELLHAVGFIHEQSRPDRDDYVKINYHNIKKGESDQFAKYNESHVDNQGIGYDFNSVMHYGSDDFSKNGLPTIEVKHSTTAPLGQGDGFSEVDIQKVWKMYQCTKEEIGDGRTTISDIKRLRIVPTKPTFNLIKFTRKFPLQFPRQFLLPSATHLLPGQHIPFTRHTWSPI